MSGVARAVFLFILMIAAGTLFTMCTSSPPLYPFTV